MLNNGSAVFAPTTGSPIATGTHPVATVLADFNGDDDLDIAVTNNSNNNVSIFLNNGSGSFAAAPTPTVATGTSPRGIAAGDFDGDGDSDLVVANFLANTLSILLNNGSGGFAAAPPLATGNNPYAVTVGDIDGDGDLDMAVSNSGASSVSVFVNDGTGTFALADGAPFAVGVSPGGVAMGDFDEDGDLDLSSANFGSNTTSILINTGATYSLRRATSDREGTGPGSGGELVFTVRRTATSEAEDVTYTLGGTATAGSDYTAPSGAVSFAAGERTARITVALTADNQYEHYESVRVTLSGASGSGIVDAARDSLRAQIRNDDPLDGTNDDDILIGSRNGETINGKGGDDRISGRGGNDHILGDAGDDRIEAQAGSDGVIGGKGRDRIHGGEGNDTVRGARGRDILFGDDGKDRVFGGDERDVMTGGSGDDVFIFTSTELSAPNERRRDVIADFRRGHDKIDLSEIDARSDRGGNQAFSWHGSDDFVLGRAGWLIKETFNRAGTADDETVISGDVDGDARADFQIELSGLKSLDAGDFSL